MGSSGMMAHQIILDRLACHFDERWIVIFESLSADSKSNHSDVVTTSRKKVCDIPVVEVVKTWLIPFPVAVTGVQFSRSGETAILISTPESLSVLGTIMVAALVSYSGLGRTLWLVGSCGWVPKIYSIPFWSPS